MFLLCDDLMEKIGNEVEIIRYNKNLKEHKKKFEDVLNDFSDLIFDIEMELLDDFYFNHYDMVTSEYGYLKNEFISEVLSQDEVIMDSIQESIQDCLKHIVLKKIDL
jgi:hypothetical protein